jgi:hypothetical protein
VSVTAPGTFTASPTGSPTATITSTFTITYTASWTFTPSATVTPPRVVSPVAAFPGDAKVTLQWNLPWSYGNKGDYFNIYQAVLPLTPNATPVSLSYYHSITPSALPSTNLVPTPMTFSYVDASPSVQDLQSYWYVVTQVNATGESPWGLTVTAIPYRPLATALDDKVTAVLLSNKDVVLTWKRAPDPDTTTPVSYGLAGYNIYRSDDGGSNFKSLAQNFGADVLSYEDGSTVYGAYYTYRVAPFDSAPSPHDGDSYQVVRVKIPDPDNKLLLDHNAFDPDRGERLGIVYSQIQPGHLWVKVYTLRGDYVATLVETDVAQADTVNPFISAKIYWDGTNASGKTVASGVYHLRLEGPQNHFDAKVAVIK